KPAMACLSSRIPYGQAITEGDLRIIEQAEELLRHEMGFRQVRVRHHGPVARIEIEPHNLQRLLDEPLRRHVVEALKALGYTYVTIDLDGFRSGSMNEALSRQSIIASQALEKERDDA
ncbi:MAG: TIGR00268 family protein, partial [Chloroflexi bacterium]|nr:TIGR00268 family protein [Chloroflexota bacterium]